MSHFFWGEPFLVGVKEPERKAAILHCGGPIPI